MARTRLIRPAFFSDETIAPLPDSTKLFYIGLWTLADDAGYFELRPSEIGAELYRYRGPGTRRRLVEESLRRLVALDRIRLLECGEHAVIPTLPDHRAKGGEQLFTIRRRHETRCLGSGSVGLRSELRRQLRRDTESYVPDSVSDSVSFSDSDSGRGGAKSENGDETEFRRRMRENGLAIVGGNRHGDG